LPEPLQFSVKAHFNHCATGVCETFSFDLPENPMVLALARLLARDAGGT